MVPRRFTTLFFIITILLITSTMSVFAASSQQTARLLPAVSSEQIHISSGINAPISRERFEFLRSTNVLIGPVSNIAVFTEAQPSATFANPWTFTVSPSTVAIGVATNFTVTITNTGTNCGNEALGSVVIDFPTAFTLGTPTVVSAGNGYHWTATVVGNSVRATAFADGDKLCETHVLIMTVPATATTSVGSPFTWTGTAYNRHNFEGAQLDPPTGGQPQITVTPCISPAVTTHPTNQTVTYGAASVQFTAAASGSSPTVQWQVSTGGPFTDLTNDSVYSGVTTGTLVITNPTVALSLNQYRAVFTNFCGSATSNAATLTVNKKTITVTASSHVVTFGDAVPTITPSYAGFVTPDTSADINVLPTCTTTYTAGAGVLASPYSTSCSGGFDNNYDFSYVSGTVTVNKKTLTVTASSHTVTYGDAAPTITASYTGFVPPDSAAVINTPPTCSTTYTAGSPVTGSPYPTVCSGGLDDNYSFSYVNGTVTVGKKTLSVTASSHTVTYGDPVPAISPAYSGFILPDTPANIDTPPTCGTTYTAASPVAGSPYTTSCSGGNDDNYDFSYVNGTVTVQKKTLTVTASSHSVLLGDPVPTITPSYTGFVLPDTAAVIDTPPVCSTTYSVGSPVSGSPYPTSCSGALDDNYDFTYVNGAVTVGKKTLTVTASSHTVTYGAPTPLISPSYSGFVPPDTAGVIDTPPTCSTTYAQGASVSGSPYTTSCTGGLDDDYSFTYVPGTVTVQKKALTVTASTHSVVFGQAPPTVTPAYSGFVLGEGPGNLSSPPLCTTTYTAGSAIAGSPYPTSCSGAVAVNYSFTYINGSITVGQAATTTTVISSLPDPSAVGFPVTVSFSVLPVSPGSGTPTGNVTVGDGMHSCTGTVAAGQCSMVMTTSGTHFITATYGGDINFQGSVSPADQHFTYPTGPIFVTTTTQSVNSDGLCSLQEAIYSANFDNNIAINPADMDGPTIPTGCTPGSPGADTIVLQDGAVYQMSGIVQDQFNVPGMTANPHIFTEITIEGHGATLERVGSLNIRAFTVGSGQFDLNVPPITNYSGTGALTLRDLYIRNFRAKGGNGLDGGGGGLGAGGAIYVNAGAGSLGPVIGTPSLTVERCTFENNSATGGNGSADGGTTGGGGGGGLGGNGGNTIGASTAGGGGGGSRGSGGDGNNSGGGGGGTAGDGSDGGGGAAGTPGGIGGFICGGNGGSYSATPNASDGCVGGGGGGGGRGTGNGGNGGNGDYGGGGGGGGAAVAVAGNAGHGGFGGGGGAGGPDGSGGNGGFGGGGGGKGNAGGIAGTGGMLAGDAFGTSGGGGAGLGGAIFNDSGSVTILNSTFVGNSAAGGNSGGGSSEAGTSRGGAVMSLRGSLTVLNTTISGNSSSFQGALHTMAPIMESVTLTIRNTIMANNGAAECATSGTTVLTSNNNLIETDVNCGGVVSVLDPNLAPLALNAPGLTPTMAITNTSSAFNMADPATSLATDQRGVARPQLGGFDIGAYEVDTVPTTTAVTSSVNPSVFGQQVTFTATVSTVPPGGTPTGTVSFLDNATPIVGCQNVQLNGSAQASCVTASLTVGNHTIAANYTSGSAAFFDSSGALQVPQVVNKANTITTVESSLNPSVFGQSVTFTATVNAMPPGGGLPTGFITFSIDGNLYCQNQPLIMGQASCTLAGPPALAAGTRVVVALYGGDGNFNASAGSLAGGQTITKADTTITITNGGALLTPTGAGQPYAVNWNLLVIPPGVGTPTGMVTVSDGTDTCVAPAAAGTCLLTSTTSGIKTIIATYAGDANFNSSISPGVTHPVFITISGNIQQFIPGGPNADLAGVTVSLTGANGGTTTSNASGNFTFSGVFSGNYTVTPSGLGKFYDPVSRTYIGVTANIANANFIAYNSLNDVPRTLTVVNTYVVPGQTAVVPVVLNSLGNEVSLDFSLNYDINPFVAPPTVACGSGAPGCSLTTDYSTLGRVGITIAPAGGIFAGPPTGLKEVVTLTFQTLPTALWNTPISFGNLPVVRLTQDAGNNPLLTNYVDGFVVFQQGLEGDLANRHTGDNDLLANDVTLSRQMVVGLLTPLTSFNEFQRADTSPIASRGDGMLDATDVVQIRRYITRLDEMRSAGGPFTPVGVPMAPPAALVGDELTRAIRVKPGSGMAGSEITVPLEIKTAGDEVAASFTLIYDPMKLTTPVVRLGEAAPPDAVLTVNESVNGELSVLIDSNSEWARSEDFRSLLNVTFEIARNAPTGDTQIVFDNGGAVSNANAGKLISGFGSGTLTISGPNSYGAAISGRVFAPDGRGLRNARVTIFDINGLTRSVLTGTLGHYSFEGLPAGADYTVRIQSKRFRFADRTLRISDDLFDVDFIGIE